jgi:hypothetical protein
MKVLRWAILPVAATALMIGLSTVPSVAASPSWSVDPLPSGSAVVVSCASTKFCLALSPTGNASTFNGESWTEVSASSGLGGPEGVGGNAVSAVSCPTTKFCMASDTYGNFAIFNPTNRTWKDLGAPFMGDSYSGHAQTNDLSCVSSSFCAAVADDLLPADNALPIYQNGVWSLGPKYPESVAAGASISCNSATWCMIGGEDYTMLYTGGPFSTNSPVTATGDLGSISCAKEKLCVATASGEGTVSTDPIWTTVNGGSTWTGSGLKGQTSATLGDVSCPKTTFCMAGDNYGDIFTYSSKHGWSDATNPDNAFAIKGVSCHSSKFCVATNTDDNALVYGRS